MKKALRKARGGKRPGSGRKPTGVDPARTIRLSDEFIATVDAWAAQQVNTPSRSEAIRRLVELGLTVKQTKSPTPKAAARAAELAAKAIDKRIDPAAPPEEREIRKRELIQGPSPFRGTRKDRPEK